MKAIVRAVALLNGSQVGGFPYLGVYLHAGANKVQCVWSHEGYMPKAELLQGLQSAVTHGKPVVLQQRVAEETRQADRLLREEQEAMYQETMMQDMQRQAAAEAEEQKENLMDALKLSRQMVRRNGEHVPWNFPWNFAPAS